MNTTEATPMTTQNPAPHTGSSSIAAAIDAAIRAIPPAWPLASSVAVNPYLGQTGLDLARTAALLERVAGASVTKPRGWYRDRIASGSVTEADLAAALAAADPSLRLPTLAQLLASLSRSKRPGKAVPTIAGLAAQASGIDWPAIIAERFGAWAAGYFDEGQALWAAPREPGAYEAWRAVATHDLTPEITGLTGFAALVAKAPRAAADAIRASCGPAWPRRGRDAHLFPRASGNAWRLGALCSLHTVAGRTRWRMRRDTQRLSCHSPALGSRATRSLQGADRRGLASRDYRAFDARGARR